MRSPTSKLFKAETAPPRGASSTTAEASAVSRRDYTRKCQNLSEQNLTVDPLPIFQTHDCVASLGSLQRLGPRLMSQGLDLHTAAESDIALETIGGSKNSKERDEQQRKKDLHLNRLVGNQVCVCGWLKNPKDLTRESIVSCHQPTDEMLTWLTWHMIRVPSTDITLAFLCRRSSLVS